MFCDLKFLKHTHKVMSFNSKDLCEMFEGTCIQTMSHGQGLCYIEISEEQRLSLTKLPFRRYCDLILYFALLST